MEPILIGVAAIVLIVAAAAVSNRTGVASPLILLAVGIGIGYIPAVPAIHVGPEWILAGVLPPLLYASAVNMPVINLRRNLRVISGLSVALVALTSVLAGLVVWALLPGLGLAGAIALGAVVSPTDAVAATSLARRLGLPGRIVAVLEGEGLVNDASALVILRSAIGATAATVSVWSVAGNFLFAVAVAVAVGLAIGLITVAVRSRFSDPVTSTAISFAVPFVAYLPAEELGASGVLAVVVAGIVTGHRGVTRLSATQRLSDHTNWRTIAFVLEHAVFLLMGLEFRTLVDDVSSGGDGLVRAVGVGLLLAVVVVAIRFLFVLPQLALLGRRERRHRTRVEPRLSRARAFADEAERRLAEGGGIPVPHRVLRGRGDPARASRWIAERWRRYRRSLRRAEADLDFVERERLDWRSNIVISAAGMRGVVTLAAAQTLPLDTPYRSTLVLAALLVAVVTLLGMGPTLPFVVRASKVARADGPERSGQARALIARMNEAARAVLDDDALEVEGSRPDPDVIARLRARYPATPRDAPARRPEGEDERRRQFVVLEQRMRRAAQEELLDARAVGDFDAETIARAQDLFDLEEYRLGRFRPDD